MNSGQTGYVLCCPPQKVTKQVAAFKAECFGSGLLNLVAERLPVEVPQCRCPPTPGAQTSCLVFFFQRETVAYFVTFDNTAHNVCPPPCILNIDMDRMYRREGSQDPHAVFWHGGKI